MAHNRFPLHLQPQQDADQSLSEDPPTPNLLGHMLKQLKPGQDLSRVLIPAFFLEPRSILEKYTDLMMHPQVWANKKRSERVKEKEAFDFSFSTSIP